MPKKTVKTTGKINSHYYEIIFPYAIFIMLYPEFRKPDTLLR